MARLFNAQDALYPGDLDLLSRALSRICAQRGLTFECPEAADIAAALLRLFQSGIRDEAELTAALATTQSAA